jgi:hypothetical protein
VRYLDQHIYVDDPRDVMTLYFWHGQFWTDLPIALSGPLQLISLVPALSQTRAR